jgi:hypothetical protein
MILFPLCGLFMCLMHLKAISAINIIPHYRAQVKGMTKKSASQEAEKLFRLRIPRQIVFAEYTGMSAKIVYRTAEWADDTYGIVLLDSIVSRKTAGVFGTFDVIYAISDFIGNLF